MSASSTELAGVPLEVSKLTRSYDKDKDPVLQDISFEVSAGEMFVIMGASGSGKSVLLRHLIGLEKADSGKIHVDGQDITAQSTRNHSRLAMVFQSGALLNSLTVGENVGLYLSEHRLKSPDEIARDVRHTLDLVGLTEVKSDGDPSKLSGGQKKRVAIARAMIIEPHLIFYDEPTSELDPHSAVLIGSEIKRLNQRTGVTSVVVTHDPELALTIGHRIAIMEKGAILRIATATELKNDSDPFIQGFLSPGSHPVETAPFVS